MKPKLQVERLELLYQHMGTVDPEDFDMSNWKTCLGGHAALMPEFQALGLKHSERLGFAVVLSEDGDVVTSPRYALSKVFGLTYDESSYLFYRGASGVVEARQRLRDVINGKFRFWRRVRNIVMREAA